MHEKPLLTFVALTLLSAWIAGCADTRKTEEPARNTHAKGARLMEAASHNLYASHPMASAPSTTHSSGLSRLELRRMELAHQERLAALEAQKAEAIERLKMQKQRSIEEIRRQSKEIEAQNALRLEEEKRKYAALLAEKEKALKAMETNASLHRDQTQKEIARLQNKNHLEITKITGRYATEIAQIKARLATKRIWILVVTLLILLLLLFLFYRYRKRVLAAERQAQRRHEAEILQRRLHHERVDKILQIIAAEETGEAVKIELARLLHGGITDPADPKLLEYRKKATQKNKP